MSLRIDTSEWISGALLIGETGLGVLGSAIPSTGTNGPAYTYNDLTLPADNGKEICGRITTWPSAGTLTAYEDTSFSFVGPDGSYTAIYQLYVDGVATGSPTTISFTFGPTGVVNLNVGGLTLTGPAPTVTRTLPSGSKSILPASGGMEVTGPRPSVVQSGAGILFLGGGNYDFLNSGPRKKRPRPPGAYDFLNPRQKVARVRKKKKSRKLKPKDDSDL